MKKELTILLLFLGCFHFSKAQTILSGKVTDEDSREELIAANVIIQQNGVFIAGVSTDFNGNYQIKLEPGNYEITVFLLGYPTHLIKNIIAKDRSTKIDIPLKLCPELDYLIVKTYDNSKNRIIKKQVNCNFDLSTPKPLPTRSIELIAAASTKCRVINSRDELYMKWLWTKNYYLDGILVEKNTSNISSFDIDQIQVFTNGVPAAFEDSCNSVFTLMSN